MARQTVLSYADQIHDGAVLSLVKEMRADDATLFDTCIAVREKFGVNVTPETVRTWSERNGVSFARTATEAAS